jgi:hypothetical protein
MLRLILKKPTIAPPVRARLEELGVDFKPAKLVTIMGVSNLGDGAKLEPLGGDLSASHREMQEWLKDQDAHQSYWVKAGVIAATIAALLPFWRGGARAGVSTASMSCWVRLQPLGGLAPLPSGRPWAV